MLDKLAKAPLKTATITYEDGDVLRIDYVDLRREDDKLIFIMADASEWPINKADIVEAWCPA